MSSEIAGDIGNKHAQRDGDGDRDDRVDHLRISCWREDTPDADAHQDTVDDMISFIHLLIIIQFRW